MCKAPDNLIDGLMAGLAGLLQLDLPFILVAIAVVFIKNMFVSIKQQSMEGYVNYMERAMNILLNIGIVWIYQAAFMQIIAMA